MSAEGIHPKIVQLGTRAGPGRGWAGRGWAGLAVRGGPGGRGGSGGRGRRDGWTAMFPKPVASSRVGYRRTSNLFFISSDIRGKKVRTILKLQKIQNEAQAITKSDIQTLRGSLGNSNRFPICPTISPSAWDSRVLA